MSADIAQLGLLLFASALVAMITRRLHLPYTVGLVLAGMGLYFAHIYLKWHLTKDLIFSVFLPPLVFEAALFVSWSELKKDLPVIALLASVGVILSAALCALGMHCLLHWGWDSAVVFGVLIAATDPVSVIATFKESKVHGRVRLLIEAESLLNDGTAAVAFVTVLGVLAGGNPGMGSVVWTLVVTMAGGVAAGALVAGFFLVLAGRTPDYLVEVTFTTLAAYGSFLLAEHFHVSGVLASLTAGLLVGHFRASPLLSEQGRGVLRPFWEYVAFLANSMIFLLIGAEVAQQHFEALALSVGVALFLVLLGRAAAVYPLCAVFSRSRLKVDLRIQHVLFWGGLRGALALALALALPPELAHRGLIVTLTFAVVAFSVFVQGLTIPPLLRYLKSGS